MVSTIFMLVRVVYSEQRSGKSSDLAEADEERLMNLPLRVDKDSAVKHDHSSDREDGCRKQLYVDFLFHAAKVVQKREATKKVTSRSVRTSRFSQSRVKSYPQYCEKCSASEGANHSSPSATLRCLNCAREHRPCLAIQP